LDVCTRLALVPTDDAEGHREILRRIIAMLTKLIRSHQRE
jgi:hypothetical protein